MTSAAALPPLEPLLRRSAKRTRDIFASCPEDGLREDEKRFVSSLHFTSGQFLLRKNCSARIRLSVKINDEYKDFKELPPSLLAQQGTVGPARPKGHQKAITAGRTSVKNFSIYIFVLHPSIQPQLIPPV
jgi:pleiotropic regulator 1